MAARVTAVIPARLGGKRFPGKVLYPFRGKPLLFYVWNDVRKCKRIEQLIIATDSAEIEAAARAFGAEVFRSTRKHHSGSDRAAEVAAKVGGDIIVNIQADNLGLKSGVLDRAIGEFVRARGFEFGTMATRIVSDEDLLNPNSVKVIVAKDKRALWFSRYPIPFIQHATRASRSSQFRYRRHIGVYLFRRVALRQFAGWSRTELEKIESLEQLRILEHGRPMWVYDGTVNSVSVDSPGDIRKLNRLYNK